jgi:NADPH-dependent ferric siderophore reductase
LSRLAGQVVETVNKAKQGLVAVIKVWCAGEKRKATQTREYLQVKWQIYPSSL